MSQTVLGVTLTGARTLSDNEAFGGAFAGLVFGPVQGGGGGGLSVHGGFAVITGVTAVVRNRAIGGTATNPVGGATGGAAGAAAFSRPSGRRAAPLGLLWLYTSLVADNIAEGGAGTSTATGAAQAAGTGGAARAAASRSSSATPTTRSWTRRSPGTGPPAGPGGRGRRFRRRHRRRTVAVESRDNGPAA